MIRTIGRAITRYNTSRKTYAALQGLSDHQLADIGLTRHELLGLPR